MQRTIRGFAVAVAIALLAALIPTLAASPAAARSHWDEVQSRSFKAHDGATHYQANLHYKWGTRPKKGHDLWILKPMYISTSVYVTHPVLHPKTWCWQNPPGARDYYVVDFRFWNPATKYDSHRKIKIDCQNDGANSGHRVVTQMPMCRVPAVDNGGRNPTPRREWCRVSVHVKVVNIGPSRNTYFTILKRAIIKR